MTETGGTLEEMYALGTGKLRQIKEGFVYVVGVRVLPGDLLVIELGERFVALNVMQICECGTVKCECLELSGALFDLRPGRTVSLYRRRWSTQIWR